MILYCVYKDSNNQNGKDQTEKPNKKRTDREAFEVEVMVDKQSDRHT